MIHLTLLALSTLNPQAPTAEQLLAKVTAAIDGLGSVRYQYKRVLDYPAEKFHHEMAGASYLEFKPKTRFRFESADGLVVFNGSETFFCSAKTKSMALDYGSDSASLDSASSLKNSYLTLRNSLGRFGKGNFELGPPIGGRPVLLLKSPKQVLGNVGAPSPNAMDAVYEIVVDPSTHLPVCVTQRYGNEGSSIRTEFSQILPNPAPLAAERWAYSAYLDAYPLAKPEDIIRLEAGKLAPDWKLPAVGSKAERSLKELRGKLVMIDFWIVHCSPCVTSVPKLNAIQSKYKGSKFALLAVNASDSAEDIAAFNKRNGVTYETLWQGAKTAKAYGVTSFPSVVLVGKDGTVLFSGLFDAERIEKLISENL